MSNSDCYWCGYELDDLGNPSPPLCCFDEDLEQLCEMDKVCPRFVAYDRLDEYIRNLVAKVDKLEELNDLLFRLP